MVDVRTQTNHTKPTAKREDPRAKLREERQRRLRLVAGSKGSTVKVYPANDDMRRVLRHPSGMRFRGLDQPVEWPNDTFTKRRIAEGAVRTDGPAARGEAAEVDESLNPRQQAVVRKVQDVRPGNGETALRLASLSPNTAVSGSADIVMTCNGTGFTADTVIKFGDYDEPTTFVSATKVTTGVKPSLFAPAVVPVLVHTGAVSSEPLDFTFTAAAEGQSRAKAPHSPPKHD